MPDGPEAILMESIYEAMAFMESAHTSKRTKRGMHGSALKCMHNGVVTYGYALGEDGRHHIDEGQAEVVREIYRRRLKGESTNTIATNLAKRGVKTTRENRSVR